MKELANLQVKSFRENLIKFKNDFRKKNEINNRVKKDSNNHYERNKFKGVKHIYLKTSIYLMKKKTSLHMKVSGICLMKKMSLYMNLHLNQ